MKPGKVLVKARQVRLDFQARIGRIVTLSEAAAAMGMDSAALSRIENSRTNGVDYSTLAKLCAYYGVGVCELLEYTEDDSRIAIVEESEDGPESEERAPTYALTAGPSSVRSRRSVVLT
jgi:DNA-binding Xre family transcriptional regulator